MKGFPVMVMALLVSGALALAQVCPSGYPVTVIPSGSMIASGTVMSPMVAPGVTTYPSGVMMYPGASTYPSGVTMYPGVSAYPSGAMTYPAYPMTSMSVCPSPGLSAMGYSTSMGSQDTALILNEIRALRGDVRATALTMQGQMLASRINSLMAQETAFRQAIAANPNLPNAQLTAIQLNAEALALNRDIASFNTQLSLVPQDQRPYMAQSLNSFDVAVWQPTLQALNTYQTQFATATTSYQPAYAANPWLQNWVTNYQASLSPLIQTAQGPMIQNPQIVASSVRWWNQPMVLGSTEVFPATGQPLMAGQTMVLPSGAVIFIPAGTAAYSSMYPMGTMGTQPGMVGTMGTQPGTVGTTGTTTIGTATGGATTETPAY